MRIRIADKRSGECLITANKDLDKGSEYVIKSLCMLQLMCMNIDPTDQKFIEFIKILRDSIKKFEALYNPEGNNEPDPFEQFNTSII